MLPPNERRAIVLALLAIVAIATLAYLVAGLFDTPFASALSIVVAPAVVGLFWLQQTFGQGRHDEMRKRLVTIGGTEVGERFELPRSTRFETLIGPRPIFSPGPSAPTPNWLEAERQSWKNGAMGWNPPGRMELGRRYAVEVVLGTQDVAKLRARLEDDAVAQFEPVKIGRLMRVQLVGSAFSITAESETDQPTFDELPTRWTFSVIPQQSGSQKLGVRVAIRMRNGQQQEVYDVEVLKRDVEVWVGWSTRFVAFCRAYFFPVLGVIATGAGFVVTYLLDLTSAKTWVETNLGPVLAWLKGQLGF